MFEGFKNFIQFYFTRKNKEENLQRHDVSKGSLDGNEQAKRGNL
jgi:hypothetical protein